MNILSRLFTIKFPDKTHLLIATVIFLCVILLFGVHALDRFELVTYDYRVSLMKPHPPQRNVIIVEISEDSIAKIGRWPWDRDWHATLISILKELGAQTILMDVIFSEESLPDKDAALAQAIQEHGGVYLPIVVENFQADDSFQRALLKPIPVLEKVVKGAGHINVLPDSDGTIRRVPAFVRHQGTRIPHISLVAALDLKNLNSKNMVFQKNEILLQEGHQKKIIPLDEEGNVMLRWLGEWTETFRHFSYIDVLSAYAARQKGEKVALDLDVFQGAICFIGGTAIGLADIRPTSIQANYPAVGVNITFLENLLEHEFIFPLSKHQNAMILLSLFFILLLLIDRENYFKSAALITSLAVVYSLVVVFVFVRWNLWINWVYPLFLIVVTYLVITLYDQLNTMIERKKLFRMATRDSLTGLCNIGHFKQLFKAELAAFRMRPERKLSIIMSDIDNFKKINDTYGHLMGDRVLKEAGQAMDAHCRALDVAARYGGEELIVMLPGANEQSALKIADKIRLAIAEKKFPAHIVSNEGKVVAILNESETFNVTVSLGVAEAVKEDKEIEDIIGRADKALYEAKHTGKNKAIIAPKPESPKPRK